jgi:hypothetical protein
MGLRRQDLNFAVTATATKGGLVTLTATGLPNGAILTDNGNNTATLSWIPTWGQIGNTNITVHGIDTLGNVGDFAIGIVVAPQNGAFSLRAEPDPDLGSNDGQTFLFTLTNAVFQTNGNNVNSADISVVDSNGSSHELFFRAPEFDPLTVTIYSNAVWEQDRGVVTAQPLLNLSGPGLDCSAASLGVNFRVKQLVYGFTNEVIALWGSYEMDCEFGGGLFGEIRFNADVPVAVQAPFTKGIIAGLPLQFTITASSVSSNNLALTTDDLPDGASFQDNGDNTGVFSWNPSVLQTGSVYVSFRADDGIGQFDTAVTKITVDDVPLSVYGVQKGQAYIQRSAGAPHFASKGQAYEFTAFVDLPTNGTAKARTVQLPSGSVESLSLQPDGKGFAWSQAFSKQHSLDAAFTNGVYSFYVTPAQGDPLSLAVNLSEGTFPKPPHLSNWIAAQNVNAGQDLILTWDAFPGGTTNDFAQLEILDPAGNEVVFTTPDIGQPGALDGTSTAALIPANTFTTDLA